MVKGLGDTAALWLGVKNREDVDVILSWGAAVLNNVEVSALSVPRCLVGSLLSHHSGGLDNPTPSSGLLAGEDECLRGTNSLRGSPVTAEAKLWLLALGDRVRWTCEMWPVLGGDSDVDEAVVWPETELSWTDNLSSRLEDSVLSFLIFTSSLPTTREDGGGSSLWPPTASSLLCSPDANWEVLSSSSMMGGSCLLALRKFTAPVESSVRWSGSDAGLRGVAGDVEGEGELERLRVAMVIDVMALGFVLGSVTPSLAAISRIWASRSGWGGFWSCTLESEGSVLTPCSASGGWSLVSPRVVNVCTCWASSCRLGALKLDAALLSVSVLPWLWKKTRKKTVCMKLCDQENYPVN